MSSPASPSTNGHTVCVAADRSTDLASRFGSVKPDDASLFTVFATLAKEACRDDLHAEFTRRAQAPTPAIPPPTYIPQPDAERHQQLGCRLIREGKLADAERAFREAIRLDPRHADAHGNLGVAFAHQRRLSEAEAAFRLAIRLDPANLTMTPRGHRR